MSNHLMCPDCKNGIKEGKIEEDELILIHKGSLILIGCANCKNILSAISARSTKDD